MGQGYLTQRRVRRAVVLATVGAAVAIVFARPAVYEVDGVSMAPGLVPGDRVTGDAWPFLDRLRRPRRFERWVLATADEEFAIKRIVGLPGDLAIDGTTVLKEPRQLADIAAPVSAGPSPTSGSWSMEAREIPDDVAIDAGHSVVLAPARDVGFAAVVAVEDQSGNAVRARAIVGRTAVTWRLRAGRYALVAGRLDGHAVAVAWRLRGTAAARPGRSCLPQGPPDRWSGAVPWAEDEPTTNRSPSLGLKVEPSGGATTSIEQVELWRDVWYRPAADGVTEWRLAGDAVFTLGDHPAVSRDSRHWGPVSRAALRHRVAAVVFADR